MRKKHVFLAALILALPVLYGGSVLLAETEGEVTVGANWFADENTPNSAKFEEYREVPSGFVAPRFVFSWEPGDRFYLDLSAFDISEDDQRGTFEFGGRDKWRITTTWNENPRQYSDHAWQLHSYNGNGVFTIADSIQSSLQAAASGSVVTPGTKQNLLRNAIYDTGHEVDLGYQRKTYGSTIEGYPLDWLTLGVSASRETREGTFMYPGTYYPFANTLGINDFAAPMDYTTDNASFYFEIAKKNFNVGGSYFVSSFDSDYNTLFWDNPLFLTDTAVSADVANPAHGQSWLGSDSDFYRWEIHAAGNLPGNTRLYGTYSQSKTEQDDAFLPMTVNTLLTPSALPADNFDGEYENTLIDLRATGRPHKMFDWKAWWRQWEQDNNSPSLLFEDMIVTDYEFSECADPRACTQTLLGRRSLPYGYKQTRWGASVGFTPVTEFTVGLEYENVGMDREHAAVESSDEDNIRLTVDWDITDMLFLRAGYTWQEREADNYHVHYYEESFPYGEAYLAAFNEGGRRYYWTDRDRDVADLLFEVTPTDKFSIYAQAEWTSSDYSDPETGNDIGSHYTVSEDRDLNGTPETYELLLAGRTDDDGESYTLGFTVDPIEKFSLNLDYTWEKYEYTMYSRYRAPVGGIGSDNPLDDWWSDQEDKYETWTLGFNAKFPNEKWALRGTGSYARGTGNIHTGFVPGGNASSDTKLVDHPEVENTLTTTDLLLTWQARENLRFGFGWWYEDWSEDDFASDYNEPYMGDPDQEPGASGLSSTLGTEFEDYTNHIIYFNVTYSF